MFLLILELIFKLLPIMKFSTAIGAVAALAAFVDAAPSTSLVESRALPLVQSVSPISHLSSFSNCG